MDPSDVHPDSGDTAQVGARSLESQRYQAAVEILRARGCRCILRWNGEMAVPLTVGEAVACGRHAESL